MQGDRRISAGSMSVSWVEKYPASDGAKVAERQKIGDSTPWTPTLSVTGGTSGFYTIQVTK